MAQITVDPGGSAGWHSHPGGAIIIVKQGSLTRLLTGRPQVPDHHVQRGQAFIERPGEVDNVLNTGTIPYILSSPSRVCLRAPPRELTSRTQAHARV